MKVFLVLLLPVVTLALVPSTMVMTSTNRRQVMGQAVGVYGAALIAPKPAFAVAATVQRARGIYGARIANLGKAVEKGDFAAIADEKKVSGF